MASNRFQLIALFFLLHFIFFLIFLDPCTKIHQEKLIVYPPSLHHQITNLNTKSNEKLFSLFFAHHKHSSLHFCAQILMQEIDL